MKEYTYVKVKKHEQIGKKIAEWLKNAWSLHTYLSIGTSSNPSHYLLFERESNKEHSSTEVAAAAAAAVAAAT